MGEISFIWFDLGYTLVYLEREAFYQKILKQLDIERSIEEIEKAYHLADKLFMREYQGVLSKGKDFYFPWYMGVLNHYLGFVMNYKEIETAFEKVDPDIFPYWKPFHCTKPTLEQLKAANLGIGLISNWDHTARRVLEDTQLISYFDEIIISSEVGVEKPNSAIFDMALKKKNLLGSKCLYVGDNYYDDVIGSRKVGMHSLVINRFGSLGVEEITHPVIRNVSEIFNYIVLEQE